MLSLRSSYLGLQLCNPELTSLCCQSGILTGWQLLSHSSWRHSLGRLWAHSLWAPSHSQRPNPILPGRDALMAPSLLQEGDHRINFLRNGSIFHLGSIKSAEVKVILTEHYIVLIPVLLSPAISSSSI